MWTCSGDQPTFCRHDRMTVEQFKNLKDKSVCPAEINPDRWQAMLKWQETREKENAII